MTSALSLDRIVDGIAAAWTPRQYRSTSDFVSEHIRLNEEVEGTGGRYDLTENPYWAEILDSVHDPFVESIAILKSTQVGGTLQNVVAALATSEIDPAPSMFVVPTRDEGKTLRDRIYANAESSTAVIANRVPPVRLRNMLAVDLETMHIYLAWPRSKQRMRGKPCKYVWLSEIDVYDYDRDAGDPNQAAERRTDRFPESTIVRESTPVGDDSPIAEYFDRGDMRRWHCQCPHCGLRQPLKFFPEKSGAKKGRGGIAGYSDEEGNHLDPHIARRSAHYVCLNGCRIEQTHKSALIRSGRWVPEGQRLTKSGKLRGTPLRPPRIRSYHLWQILNPAKTFGDLAATYLHHVAEGSMREFVQDVLGQRFRTARRMPAWNVVGKRLAWTNERGIVPPECWFLTAGCDVQADRVYYTVRGWAPQRTSWLVDWGEFMRTEVAHSGGDDEDIGLQYASDLIQIDNLLQRAYPIAGGDRNPLGRDALPIRLIGIDSNHRTADVHEYCLPRVGMKRLRALRGDHHVTLRERYRVTRVGHDPVTGERVDDENLQLDIWGIQVDYYKQLLTDRLTSTPPTGMPSNTNPAVHPGGFYVTADTLQRGEKFLKQLLNEPPQIVTDPSTGRRKIQFRPRTSKIGVDYWDCTVYSEAMADMVVGSMGWTLTAWQRWAKQAAESRASRPATSKPRNILER